MIEELDHERAVGAQTDIGALINVADVDQDRISILPPPAPDLGGATRESAQVRVSCVIGRGQNVPVQIGSVKDRDLNDVAFECGGRARDWRRCAKQTGLPDRFKKRAASGGTHCFSNIKT